MNVLNEKLLNLKTVTTTSFKKERDIKRVTITAWFPCILLRGISCFKSFNRWFYGAMSGSPKPHYLIRLPKAMQEYIRVWLSFLDGFSGYKIIRWRIFGPQVHIVNYLSELIKRLSYCAVSITCQE